VSPIAYALGEHFTTFRAEPLGIVEPKDAAFRIENDCGCKYGAKQGATTGFIESSDALPAVLAGCPFETGGADPRQSRHRRGF